ncbi:hypothetical protein BFJ63_vAg11609 [Fusarium oxysporum f. sp. narcissi]|uniref:Uncharacterized protein n=1 Tax=Fusarium oxysporum f. sp. narcissi TaxID=451672 RepID=A0A4Q2VHI7_FUSOX|nr:hypothetical protein NW765_001699 [Fusarium oxysporum]RKL24885.1 hypothetical protein BFJ70_g12455 [Fusarium oxysporum]RYC85509.1 hypothetical protein BFJ63_vAg11609 [Fusarium oxysporum f. sp. narcissi]
MVRKFCNLCKTNIVPTSGQKWTKTFRAIWIQGNDFDEMKLSGVAAYAWNDKDLSSFVPVNPRGR